MAAATVATGFPKRPHIADYNLSIVKFTALANTNTHLVTEGGTILGVIVLSSSTNVTPTFTWSGKTLTALVSAGTPDVIIGVLLA